MRFDYERPDDAERQRENADWLDRELNEEETARRHAPVSVEPERKNA